MLDLNYIPQEVAETDGMEYEEWLKRRTEGIGGSDVSIIYEVNGWTTKRALYYAKIGLQKNEPGNPYTLDFGHAMEAFIAQWFQTSFEKKYKSWLKNKFKKEISTLTIYKDTMMYCHPLFKFMQANLDYCVHIEFKDGTSKEGIFECKTTSFNIADDKWSYDKVPYEYELQCRHYMSVMNRDFTIIACAWGNNVANYAARIIFRDYDIEEEIIEAEKDFWENNVLAHNPPPLSKEHAEQELDAYNTFSIGERIKNGSLTEISHNKKETLSLINGWLKAKEEEKALNEQIERTKRELDKIKVGLLESVSQFGDKEAYILEDGKAQFFITNKNRKTTRVDAERLKLEHPEIFNECKKETMSTSFSVKQYQSK